MPNLNRRRRRSQLTPLLRAFSAFPGASRIAAYDDEYGISGLYSSAGAESALTDMFSDARASDHTVTNADGTLTTVGSGVVARGTRGLEVYGAATNLLTEDPIATEAVTVVDATEYTIAVSGSGSAVLSVGGSGTATDGSPVTFTSSGTSLTVTISGSPDYCWLVTGDFAGPPLAPSATRAASLVQAVQGSGPVPFPSWSGTEHTFKLVVDANGVTGDRVLASLSSDTDNSLQLYFEDGLCKWGSFVGGVDQGYVAVAGVDDGGTHTYVFGMDYVTGRLTLQVDDIPIVGPELVVNGDFSDGLTGYSVTEAGQTVEVVGGQLHIVTDGTASGAQQTILTIGVRYDIELDYTAVTNSLKAHMGTEVVFSTTGNKVKQLTATTDVFSLWRGVGGEASEGYFDNVSVKSTSTRTGITMPPTPNLFEPGHHFGANHMEGVIKLEAYMSDEGWTV